LDLVKVCFGALLQASGPADHVEIASLAAHPDSPDPSIRFPWIPMSHEENTKLLVLKQGVILPGGDSDAPYGGFLMAGGRFLDHPVYRWIFPYKSSMFGSHHLWKPPI